MAAVRDGAVGDGGLAPSSGGAVSSGSVADSEAVVNSETCQLARPSRLTVSKTIWGIDRWNMVMPSKA